MKQLLKYILQSNMEHLKISETKHSISLALSSGLCVIIANFLMCAQILCSIAIVFCLLSAISSFFALSSREIVSFKRQKPDTATNLIYFKYICALSEKRYLSELIRDYGFPSDFRPDNFEQDLAREIIAISKRANSKYKLFNVSLLLLATGIIFGMIALIVRV